MTPDEFDEIWRTLRQFRDAAHENLIHTEFQHRTGEKARTASEKTRLEFLGDFRETIDEIFRDKQEKLQRISYKGGLKLVDELRQMLKLHGEIVL